MATTLNKVAGVPVFAPHADEAGDCLLAKLMEEQPWRGGVAWPKGFEGGVVHRLDTGTSGVVVAADSLEELEELRARFGKGDLVKTYRLLSTGAVPWNKNECDKEIAHHPRKKQLMVVRRGKNTPHRGKWYAAVTRFKRLEGKLWEVQITTGVTHQIRVHAAFVGVPILGDKLYGGGEFEAPEGAGAPGFFCITWGCAADGWRSGEVALPAWARASWE